MPIPGPIDPVPVPRARDAARRRPGRAGRPVEGPDPRRARGSRARAEAGEAARQAGLALDLQSRRQRLRGDERHRQAAARLVRRALRHLAARSGRGAGLVRRHAQMAAEDARRPRFRDGVHPRRRPRDLVRVEPGRLHAQLPLLPHRDDAAGAQPRAGGDRRPGDARARRARRMAVASPKAGCSPTS